MQILFRALMALLFAYPLFADNVLHPGTPVLDRPTLTVLGVQLPITGDDNFNATVSVRYRQSGTTAWSLGLPLFRVHPESTVLYTVAPQFAGSIFNLLPGTSYDIELHAYDPDGAVDQTLTVTAATRPVPGDPAAPNIKNVVDAASLASAVSSAKPGDVIQLADGTYTGPLFFFPSGTAQNPIVIRGTSEENTILDGNNCVPCNVVEIYGSYVHLERLSIRNAERALRFQGGGATGNVVRRVHIKNTTWGIGAQANQTDFYIADNILEGRLTWPQVYPDDNGVHSNDDGINVQGFGHVVAHNQISGYGDAMKTDQNGARAVDFYGNDILFTYDNGIELDGSEGNTRCFRNRFTNTWDTLSVQPILGGPAYLFRNVVVNAADEQMKFHALNTTPPQEPNGVLAYHNTFVSPKIDLNLCSPNASHHFWIENNLFVGPAALLNKAVMWCGPVDDGHFDYDGYWPDGGFSFNLPVSGGYAFSNWPNFAAMQAGGLETHGTLLQGLIFATGLIGPTVYTTQLAPQDVTLAGGSTAIDRGTVLPNINDGFTGAAPDLGALEVGCPTPVYGPRPVGMDETNEPIGCESARIPPSVSVSISPTSVPLSAGHVQTFMVTVSGTNDSRVTWSVNPPNIGTFLNGTYTAPAIIPSAQAITITATSIADVTKSASAAVNLVPLAVTISPANASLSAGQPQPFTITVTGTSNSNVTWTLNPSNAGKFSNGTYTAPSTIPAQQIVTLTATSAVDNTKFAAATITLNPSSAGSAIPIAIFGTGVASLGTLAADGTIDAHYSLVSSADASYPGPSAYVVTSNAFPIPPWMPDGPNSKWIAPRADAGAGIGNVAGNYTYRTTFDLTAFTPSTAVLSGQFAADNLAAIKLNGNPVGPASTGFGAWTTFTINSGFVSAVNTLDFVVTNSCCSSNNPTGLRVDISGTAVPSGPQPIAVAITPSTATLAAGQSQPFTVQVTGATNQGVTWTISPSGTGAMNGNTYAAPSSVTSQVIVTLKATSLADNTTYGTAKVTVNPTSATLPITIFGTGVALLSTLAADGAVDAHYSLVSSDDAAYPGPKAYVVTSTVFPIPPWMPDGPNSKWIAPRPDAGAGIGNVAGNYTYRTTFDLTGFNPTTAVLAGQFAVDNIAIVKLNGNVVGPSTSTFSSWTPFTISSGFVSGVNTLDFVVTNTCCTSDNPTGLRVDISGTAVPSGPQPIAVAITPSTATLTAGQSQPFTVQVTGTTNPGVTWTISPSGTGAMNGNTYAAPSSVTSQVIVTLKATSMADNTTYGTARVTLNPPSATVPIAIFGTGVASLGTLALDGAVDVHYSLASSADAAYPGPMAYIVTSTVFPIPPWMPDGPNSKWIAPRADAGAGIGNVAGNYTYRTTFDLTGFNPATAVLTGQFAVDNVAVIKLNGNVVGPGTSIFSSWTPFTISSGFVSGVNTLDFVVTNTCCTSDNPTGLRVDISGTVSH